MSGGNGHSTSSPDNTNCGSPDGNASTIAYIGIAVFVGIALLIILYCIRNRLANQTELLPSPLASPGIARDVDIARRSRHHGLDLEDISCLPTFPYEPIKKSCHNKLHEHKVSTAECAVCLAELEEGEMIRVLPTCKHYFHVRCIDMWLSTRSSCPMCRAHPEPEKVKLGLVPVSPPWHHLTHSSSSERHHSRQFSFGSCLGSPFVKTLSEKSLSPIGNSPFQGSWQGSPNILLTTPTDLPWISAEAHTPEISEFREIS